MKLFTILFVLIFNYVFSSKTKSTYDLSALKSSFKNFGKFAHSLFSDELQSKIRLKFIYLDNKKSKNEVNEALLELSSKKLKNNKASGNLRKEQNNHSKNKL